MNLLNSVTLHNSNVINVMADVLNVSIIMNIALPVHQSEYRHHYVYVLGVTMKSLLNYHVHVYILIIYRLQ